MRRKKKNQQKENETIFKILEENETGELTFTELGYFLRELLKNQVKALNLRVEEEKQLKRQVMKNE